MKQCSFKLLTMFHDSQVHWSSRQMKSYWKSKDCVGELLVNCLCLINFFWKLSEHNSLGLCLLVDIAIMKYVIKILHLIFICMHMWAPMSWYKSRGQRTTCKIVFFPSPMWIPGTKLRWSGLATGVFLLCAILVAHKAWHLNERLPIIYCKQKILLHCFQNSFTYDFI